LNDQVNDFLGYDHAQMLCPAGAEDQAREYWSGVVGLEEVEKPEPLRARGGVWFRCGAHGLHIGAEADFTPAPRAHVAVQLRDVAAFTALADRLEAAGYPVNHAAEPIAERRMKTLDPFGNLVEFVVGTTG
jgi:catechol 2,3-dioxygenase-like lactoylglutathione lyase family enzyme